MLKHTRTYIHTLTNNNNNNNNNKNNNDNNNNNNNKDNTNLPPKGISTPTNTPDGDPIGNSQGIGAINCCRKDLHTKGCRDPRSTSFLCKCNLTKSYLASVSLLKYLSNSW